MGLKRFFFDGGENVLELVIFFNTLRVIKQTREFYISKNETK